MYRQLTKTRLQFLVSSLTGSPVCAFNWRMSERLLCRQVLARVQNEAVLKVCATRTHSTYRPQDCVKPHARAPFGKGHFVQSHRPSCDLVGLRLYPPVFFERSVKKQKNACPRRVFGKTPKELVRLGAMLLQFSSLVEGVPLIDIAEKEVEDPWSPGTD